MQGDGGGICIWGKMSAEGKMVPDIRIQLAEGEKELSESGRMNREVLKLRIDVYGASQGVEMQLEIPGESRQSFSCTQLSEESNGERRRLECVLRNEREGKHKLTVNAHGTQGSTTEEFSWTYDITPPSIQEITLPNQRSWGRDDTLYMQVWLEGAGGDVDWEGSEIFAGGLQVTRADCPLNVVASPQAECLAVPLSELPDLPHGDYELRLKARLVDEAGNENNLIWQELKVPISRVAWGLNLDMEVRTGGVTREGWFLFFAAEWRDGRSEYFLATVDANGKPVWRTKVLDFEFGDGLLLGNHRGTDVVLASCFVEEGGSTRGGIYVANAKTGDSLSDCTNLLGGDYAVGPFWALLQGGPGKDLVVAREFRSAADHVLGACRFIQDAAAGRFECEPSGTLPGAEDQQTSHDKFLVRQTPAGAVQVWVGSRVQHWCALQWQDQGRSVNGWSPGRAGSPVCFEQGPAVTAHWIRAQPQFLSSAYFWLDGDEGVQSIHLETGSIKNFPNVSTPLLLDTHDELIAGSNLDGSLQRFSVNGNLLGQNAVKFVEHDGIGLMEGGTLMVAGTDSHVFCLKPDLSACWEGDFTLGAPASLLGVLPKSSTRSIAVFTYPTYTPDRVVGFLVDTPGLKKDAPWPIKGHDPCRSFNASVPVDKCWDGPTR